MLVGREKSGQGWGVRHLRDSDALPTGVWVCGLGRKSSGAAYGAPASTPGAQPGKTEEGQCKRGWGVPVEGVAGLGFPSRSLRNRVPFSKTRSPMDPPGKRHIAP